MNKRGVLVVDDEKNIRLTLTKALKTNQLGVETAINGEEALQKMEEGQFGVVLLDLRMPGMDGMEVLRKLSEEYPETRVIIISAHGNIETATEAMKLGAVDFIEKPFSPAEIREVVEKVFRRDSLDPQAADSYEEYIELAKKAINKQQFEKAQEQVKEASRKDPSKPEAQNLLGAIVELQGDWLTALKHYRAAASLDPSFEPAEKNIERIVNQHEKGLNVSLDEGDESKGR